ncbi:hypothetical protein FUA23_11185 [Neolewinella aurantiaca]|uniref:Uncharacterized protein n=1 Tax=Neolewinella aurantiaca TaxID=2602767 RepID=A0A5C7FSS9_9BACT|nr:hypothetical protein [Neolewinella aurantiaca]TXF89302.1 hypothetical protein FUA23_11185 [Neolewinella aurantiaca]
MKQAPSASVTRGFRQRAAATSPPDVSTTSPSDKLPPIPTPQTNHKSKSCATSPCSSYPYSAPAAPTNYVDIENGATTITLRFTYL